MKIVINTCYGGFGLSHEAIMTYGKALGLELNAYIRGSINSPYKIYDGKEKAFCIHYSTAKLNKDGTLPDKGYFKIWDIKRNDPKLIEVIEKLGDRANGSCAELKIVKIPDNVKWQISEYDGIETIEEAHRSWN